MKDFIRFFKSLLAAGAFLLAVLPMQTHAVSGDRFDIYGLIDVQGVFHRDAQTSWLRQGAQATRYGAGDNGLQLASAGVGIDYQLNRDWHFSASAIAYPEPQSELALTEAFFHYKPAPQGAWRQQWRLGAFHLPLSLENTGPLWSTEYTLTPSVINTWVGEELRGLGAEWRWQWLGRQLQSPWDIDLFAAVYGFNDPAGAMLAWRGWGSHDRIAGLGSEYPITPIPIIMGGELSAQEQYYDPFVETDERPGFYLGGKASWQKQWHLDYAYYDNQADPNTVEAGQYGWRTRFHHIGMQWQADSTGLLADSKLLAQWMEGDTEMGARAIMAGFRARYIMLVKSWQRVDVAIRWEDFSTSDRDNTPMDTNIENGESATVSVARWWKGGFKTSLEFKRWKSTRPGRHYIPGQLTTVDTDQLVVSLRYYY